MPAIWKVNIREWQFEESLAQISETSFQKQSKTKQARHDGTCL
jgi:hypothetical protein